MGNATKELVNAFNLNNYGIDKVNTNFIVRGKKIVGLFASGTNTKEYLRRIGEEIIKQHYSDGTELASEYYNLNYFPFVLDANPDKEGLDNGIVKVKLADSTDNGVIRNLKVHFANEFEGAVRSKVAALLQALVGITKEQAYEWVNGIVGTGAIGSPYLYCIAFSNEYLEKRYNSRIFELLKSLYISEFNSRLEACGLKSSDFYEYKDGMLYIKNVSDKVVRSVTGYVKGRVALDFRTPGSVESKVENCKNVLSELILKATGKFVDGYDYDDFTNKNKIKNGHSFALIPFIEENGQLKSLSSRSASKINGGIFNGFDCISDIRGKTANPQFANCKEPVYAFSNKQIAQLLPKIMGSPIAYNQINGRFEFAVDLGNFKRRSSSRSSSTVTSPLNPPTHAEPPRTPLKQTGARFFESRGDSDSGLGDSPPQLKDSGSSSGGPSSSLTELSSPTQKFPERSRGEGLEGPPRQGSEREEGKGGLFQLVPGEIDSSQSTGDQSQLSLSRSSSISSPIAWDDSTFLNPEVSNEEPKKQQVTKEKEEEKLFKALLYWFNLNNYALDPPHTNFIVKNGKIASLIDDSVDVKEYLEEIIDKTKKEYRVNKEEAYDLNEFPFQFLSNCEKNQETTVVANISRGALLNLKELFSREHEGKVEIKDIDINIVEKAVKSEKDKWVNFQVQAHGLSPKEAIKTCYPDESVLEYISITKDKGGYWINRDYDGSEVESFRKEQWPAKGTSKAEKMKSEDNKDSGISSAEATDAENVSSKAEATTSGYESMDCENTRGGSPKRTLELSVGMEELTISTDLYATKAEQHSPIKKFRSN
ncbi:hypothetical protein R0F62_03280 [Wolbachia endosymbiont of Drosophila aff. chauvacae BK-2020]|uniref:hypothetical protein n=1 Tax=Wolbachia endosymbiont of Drosophila aff. chauvacae BK-2020 TaxID=3080329 RepID=UPI00293718B1|nr:hypothetical protein [Wolbachia endosymbiont of Drosophila aff. chauvacae BK-2020]WOE62197.1 hypothetical protein R0F62_03280 [Wolbachia endosymbiont of Drosophila aff. chauvacae BK-2020]